MKKTCGYRTRIDEIPIEEKFICLLFIEGNIRIFEERGI